MGKGDAKTAKGKRFKGSFGNSRNRNELSARRKKKLTKEKAETKK